MGPMSTLWAARIPKEPSGARSHVFVEGLSARPVARPCVHLVVRPSIHPPRNPFVRTVVLSDVSPSVRTIGRLIVPL